MRVLMQTRHDYAVRPGGDTIQMLKTAEFLRELGVEVHVSTRTSLDLSRYDLVHVFNLTEPTTLCQVKNAKLQKKPVVLSPIYWDETALRLTSLVTVLREGLSVALVREVMSPERVRKRLRHLLTISKNLSRIISDVQAVLPNSKIEADLLRQCFPESVSRTNLIIVPNGVDADIFYPEVNSERRTDYVLMVSRFDFRKNQLALIKALRGSGVKPCFVGMPTDLPLSRAYYMKCRRMAEPGTLFLGRIEHSNLRRIYCCFKVHVMPSLYETPGLSTLEAAACGCEVVSTKIGSAHEYLGAKAFYCDPFDLNSIREQVLNALSASSGASLSEHVRFKYSWRTVARLTFSVYEQVLARYY
jgi:glycosyltransferase involved in cell wall biosynthesis